MRPYRDIYIKHHKVMPEDKMTGSIFIPYTGKIILGYDVLPEEFDPGKDWNIICDCDLGEIAGFRFIK